MSEENQAGLSTRILSFFRRHEEWNEVSGYHLGDIHSPDLPVFIPEGSTVVGHIFAPKVVVAGLLCGTLVANHADIKSTGQIWGDLFVVGFEMEPGGRIQGWVSSVDEHTAVFLQEKGQIPEDDKSELESLLPENVDSELLANREKQDISAFHLLQAEAATAHAARAEIEQTFEARIKEVAGGSSESIADLTTQLQSFQSESGRLTTELTETKETLEQKVAQLERHQAELELTREQISDLQTSQDEIKAEYQKLNEKKNNLDNENKGLIDDLTSANLEISALKSQIQNVEEAMKGSLQHSSELQESLERWQELAEVTEQKAKKLEDEIATLNFQQETNENQIEVLKDQKIKAEEEWQQVRGELENFRSDEGYVANEAASEVYIDEASQRMAQLEHVLLEITQEQQDQRVWFQLNLQNRLQQINQLKAELNEMNGSIHTEGVHINETVEKQIEEISTLNGQLEAANEQLLVSKNQLEANEVDLKYHLDAIEKQSQHLAEIQERLVERELQLKKAAVIIKKQKAEFKLFREKAAVHIKKLQMKVN